MVVARGNSARCVRAPRYVIFNGVLGMLDSVIHFFSSLSMLIVVRTIYDFICDNLGKPTLIRGVRGRLSSRSSWQQNFFNKGAAMRPKCQGAKYKKISLITNKVPLFLLNSMSNPTEYWRFSAPAWSLVRSRNLSPFFYGEYNFLFSFFF